jgi:hypothetical protein
MLNGFLSGSTVIIEQPPSRRTELAMYCLPRALESFWNLMVKKGYAVSIPNGEVLMFALAMGFTMTVYQHERDTVPTHFEGLLDRFFGLN